MDRKPQILLVDDDPKLRRAIANVLVRENYVVKEAESGVEACSLFDQSGGEIEMVISDVNMPNVDGVALLKHVRQKSKIPFLLMTGYQNVLDSKTALSLGATAFLTKPVRPQELLMLVNQCVKSKGRMSSGSTGKSLVESEFCQIEAEELLMSTRLAFDIFVRAGANQFVNVARKGEMITAESLRRSIDGKNSGLYMSIQDFRKHIQMPTEFTPSSQTNLERRFSILNFTNEIVSQLKFLEAFDSEVLSQAKMFLSNGVKGVTDNDTISEIFDRLHLRSKINYTHNVAVALISIMIALKNGMKGQPALFKVAAAGMLHDIGENEIDHGLLRKPQELLSDGDMQAIKMHTTRGRNLLLELNVPAEIAQVALQHHENINGSGYPSALRGESIDALSRIVRVADAFVDLVLPLANDGTPHDPKAAGEKLRVWHKNELDSQFLRALSQIFKSQSSQIAS